MWVVRFDFISTPSVIVWLNGSISTEDMWVNAIAYSFTNKAFYIGGQYLDNVDLPPTSILPHPIPGAGIRQGYVIRGGKFMTPGSGYYYKTGNDTTLDGFNSSISTDESLTGISLFPNPNNGSFKLSYKTDYEGDIIINILDVVGRAVFTTNWEKKSYDNVFDFNDLNLRQGVYLMNIIIDEQKKSTLFYVE